MLRLILLFVLTICGIIPFYGQVSKRTDSKNDSLIFKEIFNLALTQGHAYPRLGELCKTIGARLSGSDAAEKGVNWAYQMLKSYQFDRVDTQGVMVPRWERGNKGELLLKSDLLKKILATNNGKKELAHKVAKLSYPNSPASEFECESFLESDFKNMEWISLPAVALGGSVGGKYTAKVVSIDNKRTLDSLGQLGLLKNKFVLLNRPMDETQISTFNAYGSCVNQRVQGADWCSPYGALAVLVRSVSNRCDLHPHTGVTGYGKNTNPIAMIAVATAAADLLHYISLNDPNSTISIDFNCQMLPDRQSANVIAQTNGQLYPNKIIVFGGHFDSWDQGEGAHDDGAGCMHAFEALRLLKAIGYIPKHTLRCVFWMNEENGVRGGNEYARVAHAKNESHIAALESDRGGFSPRGFGLDSTLYQAALKYLPLLEQYQISALEHGGGGVDISPLKKVFSNIEFAGLHPDSQRYFDVHHAETDVFENVNKRELELGAAAVAVMIYIIDQSLN